MDVRFITGKKKNVLLKPRGDSRNPGMENRGISRKESARRTERAESTTPTWEVVNRNIARVNRDFYAERGA